MADTFHRLLRILQMVPRQPKWIDTETIAANLQNEGIDPRKRTLQRDMVRLEGMKLGLVCVDDTTKPYKWSFTQHAPALVVPGVDPQSALALRLVEMHLERLVPKATLRAIQPQLQAAKKALEGKKVGRWLDRVRLIPRSQNLVPPSVDGAVLGVVQEALLDGKQVEVIYKSASKDNQKEMVLHPLGLVHRDSVPYLIATAWEYPDVRAYLLHRIARAKMLPGKAKAPDGFNLDVFVDNGELGFRHGKEDIKLQLHFDKGAGRILEETPLSPGQVLKKKPDGTIVVEAVVPDTQVLRSWILGFGGSVEVVKPAPLRQAIASALKAGAARYG